MRYDSEFLRLLKEKYPPGTRIPVSYTHLDVYKRQAPSSKRKGGSHELL